MLDDVNLKKQLKSYLENLVLGIEQGHKVAGVTLQTVSESDLEKFVRVGLEGDTTLLRILGYNETNVDDHPVKRVLVGTTQYSPDYIMRRQQKHLAVLDLKRPEEDLNNKLWAWQVLSYCEQIDAPIGILFNGYALRVFINTHDKQLARHKNRFSDEPVATAEHINGEHSNWISMIKLLSRFSAEALQANPIGLAKKLANERIIEIGKRDRQKEIRSILTNNLASSPPGNINDVLSALATVDTLWENIALKPTVTDLIAAWNSKPLSTATLAAKSARTGINAALREKIVEVCGLKGWEAIQNANIKGLNCRLDGVEEKGYRLVPQGPNVPPGLCVQGKDTPGAKRVIEQLDKV